MSPFSFNCTDRGEHDIGNIIMLEVTEPESDIRNCKIYINGLVQERRNCIANTLELHLSCIKPAI